MKLKSGFSLAEILIALAIVSVIATMGFTIAKKGIDRAYDLYVYSGYKGLTDAIADAAEASVYIDQDSLMSTDAFIKHISKVLSIKLIETGANRVQLAAPNHIKYTFYKYGPTYTDPTTGKVRQQLSIAMEVPAKKTKTSSTNTVCFTYIPDDFGGLPIPTQTSAYCSSTIPNWPDRRDLLLFYIDDGLSGRVRFDGNYTKRTYYSAHEAFCRMYGPVVIPNAGTPLSCTGYSPSSTQGALKAVDPRRG